MKIKLAYEGQDFGGRGNFVIGVTSEDGTYGSLVCEGTADLKYVPGKSTLTFTIERVVPEVVKVSVERQAEGADVQLPKPV